MFCSLNYDGKGRAYPFIWGNFIDNARLVPKAGVEPTACRFGGDRAILLRHLGWAARICSSGKLRLDARLVLPFGFGPKLNGSLSRRLYLLG